MLTNYNPQHYDLFVAIDTSKKSYAVSNINHDKMMKSLKTIPADPINLCAYYQKRYSDQRLLYIYEAGPTGYDLYDHLTDQKTDCIVVNPASIPKAPNDKVKNNKIDSQKLARLALGGQLKGIHVPTGCYRELRHFASTRQNYAKDCKRAKQRIKSLLLFESIKLPRDIEAAQHWSARYCKTLRTIPAKNSSIRIRLNMLLDDLEYSKNKLLISHKALRSFYKQNPAISKNISYLRTLPGFGFVVSMYLLSRVGDPAHLGNVRELGSFAGLVSSENSTGEEDNRGPITRTGDNTLRSLLIEAAWVSIRRDKELKQFFCRIRARHAPKKGNLIAIVAVARKLTMRAHKILKDQRAYVIH